MKRTTFAVLAALTLLVAAPLMAQSDDTQAYESRTNPNAPSITEGSGLTITGTVVESNAKQLTLKTTTGIQHIQILPDTQIPVELTAGQNVSVDYTRTDQGVMIASKIRTEGTEAAVTETVTPTPTASASIDESSSVDESMDNDLQADTSASADLDTDNDYDNDYDASASADLDTQADLDTDADVDASMDQDTLPATGSELPLLGLLGLLSVAGAVGIRSIR